MEAVQGATKVRELMETADATLVLVLAGYWSMEVGDVDPTID